MSDSSALLARVRQIVAEEPGTLGAPKGTIGHLQRLCRAAARSVPSTGAGVSLSVGKRLGGVTAASDPTSERIEELQFVLGVGPCLEAFATRRPVLAHDLADRATSRWPGYPAAVREHGVGAVFAFPMQVGTARVGVLDVYRRATGPLTTDSLSLALAFAEVALSTVLEGDSTREGTSPSSHSQDALGHRAELHQAQGMVMVQLGVSLDEAMIRLRAHAFANDRHLAEVARDVVARQLVLE